jgi:hypothetical protein
MPMNPRLLRPKAAGAAAPTFAPAGHTRLWAVTTQSGGDITGSAETDTGYYAVKWWDNAVDIYDSGDPFSKAAIGNQRAFEVYPCDSAGVPGGQFDGFDLSDNSLTQARSEGVSLVSVASVPGYWNYISYGNSTYVSYAPATFEAGKISHNLLSALALDQFYTDLDNGTGDLFVAQNPGIDADDPTIATGKGYTVFGSVPPVTSLLLNFNGTNGSTTFTDSSPNGLTVTSSGDAQISAAESKFGGSSLLLDGSSGLTITDNDFIAFGLGDFTMECWLWIDQEESNNQYVWDMGTNNGVLQVINAFGFQGPLAGNFTNTVNADGQTTIANNVWHHIAVARRNETTTLYINGVSAGSFADTSDYTGTALTIGQYGGSAGYGLYGYIDDLRIVKGAALYTANFTPPASELEVYP